MPAVPLDVANEPRNEGAFPRAGSVGEMIDRPLPLGPPRERSEVAFGETRLRAAEALRPRALAEARERRGRAEPPGPQRPQVQLQENRPVRTIIAKLRQPQHRPAPRRLFPCR